MSSHTKGHLTQLLTRLKMYLWLLWHFSSFKEMVFLKCLWPRLPFDLISLAVWCFKASTKVWRARLFGMGCNWIFALLSMPPLHTPSVSFSSSSGMESMFSTSLFAVMTHFSNTTAEPGKRHYWKAFVWAYCKHKHFTEKQFVNSFSTLSFYVQLTSLLQ